MLSAAYAVSAACPRAADNCDQTYYAAWGPLMMRMTRHEAAARLAVSEATIDRMIKRGDLATEREPQGTRYKVWVLVDDDADIPVETGAQAEMHYAEKIVETSGTPVYTNGNDMTALRTEVGALREAGGVPQETLGRLRMAVSRTTATAQAQSREHGGVDQGAPPTRHQRPHAAPTLVALWEALTAQQRPAGRPT